ncbi:MAG: TonB-dependent receptor plug domain-containing protein, partial [Chitinophagaceae bacterium]|nr:TonB-dependent receptor plug domain-containing protein [Chitinophagaceae bacterium]
MCKLKTTYHCFVKTTLLLCLLLGVYNASAQQVTLALQVTNNHHQPLSNATINIEGQRYFADSLGMLRRIVKKGAIRVSTSAVGYADSSFSIHLVSDSLVPIVMLHKDHALRQVVITAGRVNRNEMSVHTIEVTQLKRLPVILGETDPLKAITLLPGIKNGGEAGSGIYVRGGGPDQNLVLLDNIPVYNPNHLLGFFSVFNGDAIKSVTVNKGDMNAAYGGRLSSVISIDTRQGNKDSLKYTGGIGLISSKLSVEGPLVKNKASFIISGRRTYIDQVAKLFARKRIGNNGYYFYDINANADYQIDENNALLFNFYSGKDRFSFINDKSNRFNANWGNTIAGLSWKQQLLEKKLKQSVSLIYNQFDLDSYYGYNLDDYIFTSAVRDYQFKNDWSFTPSDKFSINWGTQYILHRFKPGAGDVTEGVQAFKTNIYNLFAREAAIYVSAAVQMSSRLHATAGLRYSHFNQIGPTKRILYNEDGSPTGQTETYKKGESIARYGYPEPRVNIAYTLSKLSGIKLSYTKTIQYLHLATTNGVTFPSDLWIPSGQTVRPGIAQQFALGYYRNTSTNVFRFSAEAYYKFLKNQIEFKQGAQLLLNENIEGEMMFGSGRAYGVELFAEKKKGKLTGWIGYTLSKSDRTFAQLNNGKPFPYRYDRTHDMSIAVNYTLNDRWNFSGVFVLGTGNALTMPTGRVNYNLGYNISQRTVSYTSMNQYNEINNYRLPAYHRADICATYTPSARKNKRFNSTWSFNLYNVYNRRNPYFVYVD